MAWIGGVIGGVNIWNRRIKGSEAVCVCTMQAREEEKAEISIPKIERKWWQFQKDFFVLMPKSTPIKLTMPMA